jgi:hypothetical protein
MAVMASDVFQVGPPYFRGVVNSFQRICVQLGMAEEHNSSTMRTKSKDQECLYTVTSIAHYPTNDNQVPRFIRDYNVFALCFTIQIGVFPVETRHLEYADNI